MAGIWLDNKTNTPAPNPFSNSGAIQGDSTYISGVGVLAEYSPYTVVNSGTITTGVSSAQGILLLKGGSVTNQVGGVITGGTMGVDTEIAGSITNFGTINGNYAVVARAGGYVSNGVNSGITGASDGIVIGQFGYTPAIFGSGSTGTVVNKGRVTASGSGTLSNGIVLNVASGYVNNSGTVIGYSTLTTRTGIGIALNYGGTLVNSGILRGGAVGFSAGGNPAMKGPAIVTNTSNGTIIGDFYGVRLFSGGSVQNDGYITSVLTAGVFFKTGGTLNNTGTIKNYGPAVRSDAAATITNSGLMTVTSGGGAAVRFNGGTITNMMSGKILANGEGVNTDVGSSPATTIINAGTISSVGTAFPHNGVYMGGTGTDSVTNQSTGRIYGTTGGLHMARGGTVLNQGTLQGMGASTYGTGLYLGGV